MKTKTNLIYTKAEKEKKNVEHICTLFLFNHLSLNNDTTGKNK